MNTRRVLHDFGELSQADIGEMFPEATEPSVVQKKPYHFVLAVLAIGIALGFLAVRK